MKDFMRGVILKPTTRAVFQLNIYDTFKTDRRGCMKIGYTFSDVTDRENKREIFRGEDYCHSPMHAADSDDSIRGLIGFLSLQKGDTDAEYFENYTEDQIAFTETYECESLSMYDQDDDPYPFDAECDEDGNEIERESD